MTGLSLLSCIVSLAIHAGAHESADTVKELIVETTSEIRDPETGKRMSERLGIAEVQKKETRWEQVCTWFHSNRRDIYMILMLLSLIGIGCAFFVFNNDMDFTEAFYLCIITATTIGLGDLSPGTQKGVCGINALCMNRAALNETCSAHEECDRESVSGKWFGIFFMMLSVMALTGAIGRLSDVLGRKQFKEKINDSLSKLEISAELFQFVDVDNDGSIDKTEWFAACVKRLDLLDPIFYQIIESNFEKLDVTGDGSINRDDVKELLLKRGERENGASPNHSGSSVQFSNDNGRGGRNRTGSLSPVAENESGDENDPPTAFPESDSNGSAASNRTPLDMGFLPPINPTSTTAY